MKNLIFKGRKSGFTLAELLMVIAILVILVGLGVTGFLALRRNIQIAKYDDLAREIYVAVQNQLTRLEANGLDEKMLEDLKKGTQMTAEPEDYQTPEANNKPWSDVDEYFYHADQSNAKVMALLLPLGAVADDVRSNGFYVVEYNVQTRTVYSVFYSEKSFEYSTVSTMENFRKLRSTRKGPMVGYYGGSSVERDELETCPTPELEIINNNELRLNIRNVPTDADLTVSVTVSDGIVEKPVEVDATQIKDVVATNGKTVLLDGMKEHEHFYELFPTLTPGKDLTITVTYSKPGFLTSSASITANSLFATREEGTDGTAVATLAWARHLQNLEHDFSMLDDEAITIARQTEHIQWEPEFGNFTSIRNRENNTVYNENLKRFEGNGLEIRDLTGTNGLFAVAEDTELSGIRLVNPQINGNAGSEPVGALVGDMTGTVDNKASIISCGVYYRKLNSDGTINYDAYQSCGVTGSDTAVTGGLVGKADKVTVRNSFAALPYIDANSGASLIGSATNCVVENSYANCDRLPVSDNFHYFLSGSGNNVNHSYAVGSVNSDKAYTFAPAGNTVTDSYYAVSHRDWVDRKDLAATEYRYIGATGDWQDLDSGEMAEARVGWNTMIAPLSHPYREYLDGRAYPYPAIGALDHYGSWPDGDGTVKLKITMALINNENADYAIFAGRVIVTNEDEKDANEKPVVLFDSEKHKKSDGTFDGKDTVNVVPGTHIKIKIDKEEERYLYSRTDFTDYSGVTDYTDYTKEVRYTVEKDTEAVINFQQLAFKLTGIPAVNEQGSTIQGSANYLVDISSPMKTLVIQGSSQTEDAEAGTTVTVRPHVPSGYVSSVVWYCPKGQNGNESKRIYLTQTESGGYTFQMPSEDTEIHVMYTIKEAIFKIQYFLMDTAGNYTEDPVQVENSYKCGLGSQINQGMIDAMAESSGLPLTLDGQRVRYLKEAEVKTLDDRIVFDSVKNADGEIVTPGRPHISTEDDFIPGNEWLYIVNIHIARKEYDVTLTAEENITGVRFAATEDHPAEDYQNSVTKTFYYGATVTAEAQVAPGYGFSYWDPRDSRFLMSGETEYTFQVPAFDLNLHAVAALDKYLVTVNLLENGESWLYRSESRQADPITLTLVNFKDPTQTYPMQVLTEDTISYAMQAVVPAVPDYEAGYQIRVDYESGLQTWIYADGVEGGTNEQNERLLLYVRDKGLEATVEFFTVTYFPNKQHTLGTVPKGGTFPLYYHVTVEGNTGLLRNETDNEKIFQGWKDQYAGDITGNTLYTGGENLMLIRRTDMFAQWTDFLTVTYHSDEADGGELPVDNGKYQVGETVTIQRGSLTRKGYKFVGWKKTKEATVADFTGNQTYTLESVPLDLYPVWALEDYTLQFCNVDGTPLEGEDYTFSGKHYGDTIPAPDMLDEKDQSTILGWSVSKGGDVLYRPGETVPVTGNQTFYAIPRVNPVVVTFKSSDGTVTYGTESFGKGIPGYLNCVPEGGPVTAWSTEQNGKGDLYFCQEDGRSEKAHFFMADTTLYAVTGKVYNYNQRLWFDTLYAAVRQGHPNDGDTLIVYRNTEEPHNIQFNTSLYVIASGNRRVTWKDGATVEGGDHRLDDPAKETGEFVGCMSVYNNGNAVTLTFGKSDVPTLSMDGSTLTFDANQQSRVISLRNEATFNMYDGITLTNGNRKRTGNPDENSDTAQKNSGPRSYYGGGVYAGEESAFNMYGGTISYCTAYKGGGVYLFGNKYNPTAGSKMQMGDMVTPTDYSATAIYYEKGADGFYVKASEPVTSENYKKYYITVGNPMICYNTATRKFENEWANDDGGGGLLMLDLKDGDLVLYKGSIHNNTAYANGGGLISDAGNTPGGVSGNEAKLRIYEVDISHNTAHGFGGGILQWQGVVYIYNSILRQNTAYKSGGGIYLHHWDDGKDYDKSTVEFHYGDIADNRATESGGGIYVESRQVMTVTHGNLARNSAGDNGGGIFIEGGWDPGRLELQGGTVSDNTAASNGGGIYSNGNIDMTGGTLSGNVASNDGGGIYTTGTMNLSGGTLSGNSAISWGGGICLTASSRMTMTGGTICNNNAEKLGGGIMAKSNLILSGGSLYGNTDKTANAGWWGTWADEENNKRSPNDIYLYEAAVITIPEGGIRLSGEERVAVDSDRDNSLRCLNNYGNRLPFRFAEYTNEADYKQNHALYFTYFGTRSTDYSINTLHKPNLTVMTHDDLKLLDPPVNEPVGLYFAEDNTGDGKSSFVVFNYNYPECPEAKAESYPVGSVLNLTEEADVPPRDGYYLAGWARTPEALEEQYELYYDVVADQWKSGYESGTGWTDTSDVPEYTVKDYFSQTLYAMWRPCVVVYDLNLGPDVPEHEVTIQPTSVGPRVTLLNPDPPEYKVGEQSFRFKHWVHYIGEDVTDGKEYVPTQQLELTENLRLTAVWEERKANSFIITLYFNGGTSDVPGEVRRRVEVTNGDSCTLPTAKDLTQSGKDLIGWATTEDAATPEYAPGATINNIIADMDLYAVWVDVFDVTYNVNGGEGNNQVSKVREGEYATIPADWEPTRAGYKFLGWAEKADALEAAYLTGGQYGPITEARTLYAVWQGYKVTFNLNDMGTVWPEGGNSRVVEVDENGVVTFPTDSPQSTMTLFGWAESNNADTPVYPVNGEITPDKDMTLYSVLGVRAIFDFNYDGAPENEAFEVSKWKLGAFTIPVEDPEREGFSFMGWKNEKRPNNAYYFHGNQAPLVRSDNTFKAAWAKPVPVKLMMNDGTETVFKSDTGYIGAGFKYSLPTETESPQRTGFIFAGWAKVQNAARPDYTPGRPIEIEEGTSGLTLYAVWGEAVTLTFDCTGGKFADNQTQKTFTLPKGVNYGLGGSDLEPTSEGAKFLGWALAPDDTEILQSFVTVNENMTLYAVWEEVAPPATTESQDPTPSEAPAQPETDTPETPSEAPSQPETEAPEAPSEAAAQAVPAPMKEEAVWPVAFYLDGVDFMKHPKLSGKELLDCQWDKEEQWLTYTVPAGEDVKLLPPEIELEGWILDGWRLVDEKEDEEIVYPAGEEIPISGSMALVPVWKEAEPTPPPTETTAPTAPPATEAATPPAADPKPAETIPPETDPKPTETTPSETEAPPPEAGEETAAP